MEDKKLRKKMRLKGADYSNPGIYFITICTKERRCVLSRIVGTGVPCQEQDCKQLCKMIVNTFVFYKLCFWKLNGA